MSAQFKQLKNWFFTWNNYPEGALELLEEKFKPMSLRYCFGLEVGAQGTKHVQGCVELRKRARPTEFDLPKQIHWEKTRNKTDAVSYCGKDGTDVRKYDYALLELIKKFQPREPGDSYRCKEHGFKDCLTCGENTARFVQAMLLKDEREEEQRILDEWLNSVD